MKKITLAIAAVVIGFVMASCGNSVSPKETILKATEDFFAQAKTNLQTINNAEDFLAFVNNFAQEKDTFIQNVFADYMDEEGNLKGFTEEELTDLQTQLGDMASAFNKEEAL
jgi:PBP1b-binding outer membrane lipoprotein LpoB